jgi:hypothetical protein
MTTRIKGLTVVLERDVREDDCQHLIDAIKMLRGVAQVVPLVTDASDYVNRERVRVELAEKLMDVLTPPDKD